MSNLMFPRLRGVGWDTKLVPQWDTGVQTAKSGRDVSISYRRHPLLKITLAYEFLQDTDPKQSDDGTTVYGDFETLYGFFNRHRGRGESFLFQGVNAIDLAKYTVNGALIGTGDGSTRDFQLQRRVGEWSEYIFWPQGTPTIYVDGVEETGITDRGKGLWRLTSAPAADALVTADFVFAYRCRFDEDEVEFSNFSSYFWECGQVPMITRKP